MADLIRRTDGRDDSLCTQARRGVAVRRRERAPLRAQHGAGVQNGRKRHRAGSHLRGDAIVGASLPHQSDSPHAHDRPTDCA